MITDQSTISEAKSEMRLNLKKGGKCPCCTQDYKMYQRTITSSMALGLILLYKKSLTGPLYIHIEDYFKSLDVPASVRGDVPKMRFWDLIRPDGKDKEDGNPNSGYYKITELGKAFVEMKIDMPKHANIYNNRFFGFDKDTGTVNIKDCLKNKFNYNELLGI